MLFVLAGVLAFIGAVHFFLWFIGDAQTTGMVPSLTGVHLSLGFQLLYGPSKGYIMRQTKPMALQVANMSLREHYTSSSCKLKTLKDSL